MEGRSFLGFDFGASSGRAMLGTFCGGRMALEEIHRFANDPVTLCGQLVWDLPRLVFEMKRALNAASRAGRAGVGHRHRHVGRGLRAARRSRAAAGAAGALSRRAHRRRHGGGVSHHAARGAVRAHGHRLQCVSTRCFRLLAMRRDGDPALAAARSMLFMPDLLAYCLTGVQGVEYTIASTSQLLDPSARDWSDEVFRASGLPKHLAAPIDRPGAPRGRLLPEIARECGVERIPVFAVGGHDTASAFAAAPARGGNFARLSSGTWSLLGVEVPEPLTAPAVLEAGYTNEGGVDGSIRLLKNIMGLWIIQECKREWDRRGEAADYGELVAMAERAPQFSAIIDVDDAGFLAPGDMPARVQAYCRPHGPARARGTRRDFPRDLRRTGAQVPLGDRAAGEGHPRQPRRRAERGRRRQQERPAQPVHRRRHRARRGRRTRRGDGDRQPARAGDRRRRAAGPARRARGGGALLPDADVPSRRTAAWDEAYRRYLR